MQKKDFVTMILGTISGVLFALGMCMAMLPQWDALPQGIILGVVGLIGGLILVLVRRKMAGKPMIVLQMRTVLITIFGLFAALVFGTGMVMSLLGGMLFIGVLIGLVGIIMLLGLIPIIKGFAK